LRYRKKRYRSIICTQNVSFAEKVAKISPADPEIIVLQEIIKKEKKKKRKNLMQAKYLARSAT